MSSTTTFADELRLLSQKMDVILIEALWEDVKIQLKILARRHKQCARIEVFRGFEAVILINQTHLLTTNLDKRCINGVSAKNIIYGYNSSMQFCFTDKFFKYFEKLVTRDGCDYTKLSSNSFKISWW